MMADTLQVSLWRGGADGRYVGYAVPMHQNQTVLDVVTCAAQISIDLVLLRMQVGLCGSAPSGQRAPA